MSPSLPFILPTCEIVFFWAEKEAACVPSPHPYCIRYSLTSPCKNPYIKLSSPSLHKQTVALEVTPWSDRSTLSDVQSARLQARKYSESPTKKPRKYTMTRLYMKAKSKHASHNSNRNCPPPLKPYQGKVLTKFDAVTLRHKNASTVRNTHTHTHSEQAQKRQNRQLRRHLHDILPYQDLSKPMLLYFGG